MFTKKAFYSMIITKNCFAIARVILYIVTLCNPLSGNPSKKTNFFFSYETPI